MSALGQKQTCALQKVMSALPPIATLIASSEARRAVQVGSIKGVAENQKSESASSHSRSRLDVLVAVKNPPANCRRGKLDGGGSR
jgi:hypothetical protein